MKHTLLFVLSLLFIVPVLAQENPNAEGNSEKQSQQVDDKSDKTAEKEEKKINID